MEKFKERFFEIWELDEIDLRDECFNLVNEVRIVLGFRPFMPTVFDNAWQWRNLHAEDRDIAWNEFKDVVLGWW